MEKVYTITGEKKSSAILYAVLCRWRAGICLPTVLPSFLTCVVFFRPELFFALEGRIYNLINHLFVISQTMISPRTIRAAAKQALAVNARIVPRVVCTVELRWARGEDPQMGERNRIEHHRHVESVQREAIVQGGRPGQLCTVGILVYPTAPVGFAMCTPSLRLYVFTEKAPFFPIKIR